MESIGIVCLYGLSAVDDFRTKQVKVMELAVFAVLGILMNVIYRPHTLISVVGGVAVGLFVYLFSIISNEKIGKGDALVVAVSGLYLGFMNTVLVLWLGSLLALLGGVFYIYYNRKPLDTEVPFVPFLLLSYVILYTVSLLGGLFI